MGYAPNPAAPTRHDESMLWRKIGDHNPLFVTLTDKLAAKACPQSPNGFGGSKTRPISGDGIAA
ncbi:hypothetical protein DPM33_23190 [Mesorhizobium hawassense]|uniref:Uncharacterized protein n=1 Tax=Mesorhizobium hawassense TaxID=1209954 RepID=A0A330HP40_9HYPH|nr:hypothetical protein DPM33_23190 [Mesorhizobium hawassense]